MTKQRRVSSRPVRPKPADVVVSVERPLHAERDRAPQSAPPAPLPRPGHLEAVALYEEGVAALQAHEYPRASSLLRSVLTRYPEERELHERVRLYLNVCERHMAPRAASPSNPEERVFAATLAINAGNNNEALDHLRAATEEAPEHDYALYMLAGILALRDEVDEAVEVLLRAIEINPDNRSLARHDPDLGPLREFERVRVALEAPIPAKTTAADRRKAPRRR